MAAGSVIMGTHHEQDMREFGGLRKYMPVTFFTYLIATLAIAGVPLLSGFYSKDAILWSVFSEENPAARIHLFGAVGLNHVLWGVGFITAGLTAFYMTRSLVMTFFGSYRGHAHPHESPLVVVVPLVLLAVPSAIFGKVFGPSLMEYLAPWTRADLLHHPHSGLYLTLEYASIAIATLGIAGAAYLYGSKVEVPRALAQRFPALYRNLLNKWWVDEAYAAVIVRPIDASVNGTAILVETEGRATSSAHTGQIGHYLVTMFIGMIFLTVFWLLLG
jgi:NADH-quinone oxidoreductase subunit L